MPIAANCAIEPKSGLTYIHTRRGGATETGGDGSLRVSGGMAPTATFHPWISGGVRYQLDGHATRATAGFLGAPVLLGVPGVRRQATFATAGAGIAAELTPQPGLFATSHDEFGTAGKGTTLNAGLRLRF